MRLMHKKCLWLQIQTEKAQRYKSGQLFIKMTDFSRIRGLEFLINSTNEK